MKRFNQLTLIALALLVLGTLQACDEFVFGNINISEEDNPLVQKKTPTTGAEIYFGTEEGQHPLPVAPNAQLHNPDPAGAFNNWYTCLVMFKEGHNHYGGKMHGNVVYAQAAWRQEQFAQVHNTASGAPQVEIDKESVRNFLEEQRGEEGPAYFRLIGGSSKLWGCCLYFYDKQGKLINDSILKHSDEYQIFYTISELDEHNQPYRVMDVRYREGMPEEGRIEGVEAESFKGKDSFEQRRKMTKEIMQYVYRDTWTHNDMGDGIRNFFNIKLLKPLTRKDHYDATDADQDCVGLKGHFNFSYPDPTDGLDMMEWPLMLSENSWNRKYLRPTFLLPKFCLAVRVMKCEKGKKASVANEEARNGYSCEPFDSPANAPQWKEIIRFNIPIKIYCSSFDSDPTNDDPFEPLYYQLGREIGLPPTDAFESIRSNAGQSGLGFDAWFL